ncbi:rRNA methylase [Oceanobacillus iheyensis HTE831]|uniref:rRNA methylase n=1 Tax=Oceanobacillus iheyensis (strain DSM 14371 / CIP 107618 / JCM 11309 / KCTC 3954 / HTE831) TaxID=221109 RepID=Q8EPH3_OCEIH|nr:RNA methyltransferase [Oceanobacillus iheyensis]BAC14088.1 rRNA methylase [Oceanobacillus iheyensis HTE831]
MITSIKNEKVKSWKKLHRRKERLKTNTFLIDGIHLIQEALKSNWVIQELIVVEGYELPNDAKDVPVAYVSENVLKEISQTQTPQGVIAVVEMNIPKVQEDNNLIILLDAIQDPGNMGTIIRTADAAGVDAVVLGDGCVDIFNDKVIRATQGSIFHIPIYTATLEQEIHMLQTQGFTILATALHDAVEYTEVSVHNKVGLILGNEGAGIAPSLLNKANQRINIPIYGKAESLNVGIAAGILMYHLKK